MKTKIYTRVLMVMIIMLFSYLGFATDRLVPSVYGTIQAAIDASIAGDRVVVSNGTYVEDLSIPVGLSNLEIFGEGSGTIIKGVLDVAVGSYPLAVPNIEILASGVKIHDFTIEGPDWALGRYVSGMVIGATNVEIYGNAFKVTSTDQLYVNYELSQGIQTILGVDISGLKIHDNTFSDLVAKPIGYDGIYVNLDPGTLGTYVEIYNNSFTGNIYRAILTERSKTTINANSVVNDLAPWDGTSGGWQGINVGGTNAGSVTDVSVTNNTVKGSGVGKGFLYGLKFGYTGTSFSNVTATNNSVSYTHLTLPTILRV